MIHTCWLKPFAEYFAGRGVSLERYCDHAQIPPVYVTSGEGWITKVQLYEFLQAIADGENMPEVGFVVGELLTPDTLGKLGAAMACETTLGGVIRTFCELINRHVEGNRCWLEEGDQGEVWLYNEKVASEQPGQAIADDAGLMSMINLTRLVAGRSWYPAKAFLQTREDMAYRRAPGLKDVELRFNKPATGFAFPAHWLLRSTKHCIATTTDDVHSPGFIKEGASIPAKLELLLREILGVGGICPTVRLMAEICGFSERSLHRELKLSGQTYQEILDRVRFEQACAGLANPDLSIKELAFSLGYSGSNNFVRAFKRMSGTNPTAFRHKKPGGVTH